MRFLIVSLALAAGFSMTPAPAAPPAAAAAAGRPAGLSAHAAAPVASTHAFTPNATNFSAGQRTFNQNAAGRTFFNQGGGRRGYAYAVPPFGISRGWDYGHRHFWNNGYYGWTGGGWVLLDDGEYDAAVEAAPVEEAQAPEPAPVVADTDSLAMEVQRALRKRGYRPGPINGIFDPQTRSAIAALQSDLGLETTGHVSASVLAALGIR